jgi:hypothetical protein
MGKKNITKKFAAVKRIISTQDDRMYLLLINPAKKINKNSKNRKTSVNYSYKNRPLMMLKLRKCTLCSIVDPNSHHACSSPTTMRSGHLTEFCSIPTSSTFQSKTSWTSSRPPWTACWASASRTSQTA